MAERGTTALTDRIIVVLDLWTVVAGEQLAAMAAVIRAQEHVFGLFPLARSIIEHSAASVWVLDPDVSPERRCARAALAVDRSNEELVVAAAHLANKQNDVYQERRRAMRDLRAQLLIEFPEGTDLQTTPKVIAGEDLLSPTAAVRAFAEAAGFDPREWEGIYDYLCAAANHPTLAAFEFFGESEEDRRQAPTMSEDFLERLARAVVAPYLMALQGYSAYCGWDASIVDALHVRVTDVLPTVEPST